MENSADKQSHFCDWEITEKINELKEGKMTALEFANYFGALEWIAGNGMDCTGWEKDEDKIRKLVFLVKVYLAISAALESGTISDLNPCPWQKLRRKLPGIDQLHE